MTRILLACVLSAFLPGCAPKAQDPSEPVAREEPSPVLREEDLRIWPTVDTSAAVDQEAIACLRRFFAGKLKTNAINDYWYSSDFDRYGPIYSELLYAEYDSIGDLRHWPTLLGIAPGGQEGERVLRVRWASTNSSGALLQVPYVFGFLARATEEGVRLALPIAHNTRRWERRIHGNVTYVVSPEHTFSEAQAAEQQRVIGQLVTYFGIPAFPITYYSFAGPADLFRAKGFEEHPLMYAYPSGGMVDQGSNVYSGNNKDIYTHEIVHLFTLHKFGVRPALLDEGLATLIGGSVEHDYAWHRAAMAHYLAADPSVDLRGRCNTYVTDLIAEQTSVPAMIGALLCERILRKDGKEGLFRVMASGTDPWPALARYGITPETLTSELRVEAGLSHVRPW